MPQQLYCGNSLSHPDVHDLSMLSHKLAWFSEFFSEGFLFKKAFSFKGWNRSKSSSHQDFFPKMKDVQRARCFIPSFQ